MKSLPLDGAYIIPLPHFEDTRGSFTKVFHTDWLDAEHLPFQLAESYYSISKKNTIRGMHFQVPPHEHKKIVFCTGGAILDVLVDIRKSSPTYGQHYALELSETSNQAVYIPEGFAHGFMALTDQAVVHYLVSSVHAPAHDFGIRYDSFAMQWPLSDLPVISDRDAQFPTLSTFVSPF